MLDTSSARGDKPPLDSGRGGSSSSATAEGGRLWVFLHSQMLHQRLEPCTQHILSKEGFFGRGNLAWQKPTADSSRLGFHPDPLLLAIYLAWTAATSAAGLSGELPEEQVLQTPQLGAHQTPVRFPAEPSPAAAGTPGLDGEAWKTSFASLLPQRALFTETRTRHHRPFGFSGCYESTFIIAGKWSG